MANFNFNKVILGGRITRDVELRTTSQGIPVTSFSIAVNRPSRNGDGQQKADFFNCTAWRTTAEFISKYFHRGSSICITGSLQNREWTDNNGTTHRTNEVLVDEVTFVDSKSDNVRSDNSLPPEYNSSETTTPAYSSDADTAPKFEEMSSDDDLPF